MDRRDAMKALCGLPAATQITRIPTELKPSDMIVIEVPGLLVDHQYELMRAQVQKLFPNNKVLVLTNDMKFRVVSLP